MKTLQTEQELEVQVCVSCGITFAAPVLFLNNPRKKGGDFYCPNGHSLSWNGNTELDRLKKELKEKENAIARQIAYSDQIRADRDHAEKRLAATKGVVTRMKNRVSKGVCPVCNRHFTALERHMQGQHPDWAADETNS
jgi:predicted RNA-binding Zn-ribbon protein involved in translation (DUF1610 family)